MTHPNPLIRFLGISMLALILGTVVRVNVLFADLVQVNIGQIEDRMHAVVTDHRPLPSPPEVASNRLKEAAVAMENGTVDAMGSFSQRVGKRTDRTVDTVQTLGNSAFSWLFQSLDFKNSRTEWQNDAQRKN